MIRAVADESLPVAEAQTETRPCHLPMMLERSTPVAKCFQFFQMISNVFNCFQIFLNGFKCSPMAKYSRNAGKF